MNLAEYSRCDGLDLVELVESRQLKPSEVIELALAAVDAINPAINAVVGLAVDEAVRVQAECAAGPMRGLPFLVKDLGVQIAGMRCEMGSRLMQGFVASRTTELAGRYEAAGLAVFGRTNTPEFGLNPSTEPLLHGPTRNPWDLSRSAGGSSGGAAAAVAAGIVPIAHGTDGGGSIRCPAAACGLFGLKPSRGRNPSGADADEAGAGFVAEHVITRSVRDSAVMLDLTADAGFAARLALPASSIGFRQAAEREPKRLRIGVTTRPPAGGPSIADDCIRTVEETAMLCATLGHELVEADWPVSAEEIAAVFADLHAVGFAGDVPSLEAASGRKADETMLEWASWKALERGRAMTEGDAAAAETRRGAISRRMIRFSSAFDVLLSPVLSGPAVALGVMDADDRSLSYLEMTAKFFTIMPFTPVFNLTGQPAMSMPLGQAASGMPIGVQFAGRFGDEATLFSLAGQIERAAPWRSRVPPCFAGS